MECSTFIPLAAWYFYGLHPLIPWSPRLKSWTGHLSKHLHVQRVAASGRPGLGQTVAPDSTLPGTFLLDVCTKLPVLLSTLALSIFMHPFFHMPVPL